MPNAEIGAGGAADLQFEVQSAQVTIPLSPVDCCSRNTTGYFFDPPSRSCSAARRASPIFR